MTLPAVKPPNPEILELLFTREEAALVQTEAETVKRRLFSVKPPARVEALWQNVSPKGTAVFQKIWLSLGENPSREKIEASLTHLQEELRSLPVVKITLAFAPPPALVEEVARWARTHFNAAAILEVSLDPALLGGAVVSFGGRYFDRSLRQRLQQRWPALKEELAKELAAPAAKT